MNILGIETSCDETAAAIVRNGSEILSNPIASQVATHRPFGGVIPELAAREHLKNIDTLVEEALKQAGLRRDDINAIAVTQGPGLIGALLVGVSYAKGFSLASGLPLIPVDHVHAHVHGAFLSFAGAKPEDFPCLALVVSGGHTNMYFMEGPTRFKLIAHSMDDACGESFDKVAKMLGRDYPGGPAIEALARNGKSSSYAMPMMIEKKDRLVFSYSGLKTHMLNLIRSLPQPIPEQALADLCAGFQDAALGQIVRKIEAALIRHPEVQSVLIAGGVAANKRLQELLGRAVTKRCLFPKPALCSDNAAMIAAFGYHLFKEKRPSQDLSWDAYARYPFETYLT